MNKFRHNNDGTTTIFIESKKYGNKEVLIDTEDWERVKEYKWSINRNVRAKRKEVFYIVSTSNAATRDYKRGVKLHRVILDCHDLSNVVDHISTDSTLDNRKSNLRITTRQENKWNRGKPSNSKSKYIGVGKSSPHRWFARIGVGRGQHRHLGTYGTQEEAAIARDREVVKTRAIVNPQQLNFPERLEEYRSMTNKNQGDKQ